MVIIIKRITLYRNLLTRKRPSWGDISNFENDLNISMKLIHLIGSWNGVCVEEFNDSLLIAKTKFSVRESCMW